MVTWAVLALIPLIGGVFGFRPVVKIEDGTVEGIPMETFKGRKISAFYNIPYTQRLNHRRRFQELKDADPWEGVLDGGGPPVVCPQVTISSNYDGVENCLFIHVFTPSLPNSSYVEKRYPVVVYIHGGAFYFYAGGTYGPRYLLDKDVVYVSFNYRIGVPGFGSSGDYVLSGNLGYRDQVKALEWIQRNIHVFSGDKNSVTLFGMSAGAASVHFHYVSKKSRGLFHRGVMLGGIMTDPWAVNDQPRRRLERISKALDCPTNSTFDMVVCLENTPIKKLSLVLRKIQGPALIPLTPCAPNIDDFINDPILPEYPYDSLRANKFANMPMLVSNAENEGIFTGAKIAEDKKLMDKLDKNWPAWGKFILDLGEDHLPKAYFNETMHTIRKYYFGDKRISTATGAALIQMMTDRYFHNDARKTMNMHAMTNPRVYYYLFGFKGPQSSAQGLSSHPETYGASHVDDLFYMVNVTNKRPLETNATALRMIDLMTTMLSSFAKTGRPDFGNGVDFQPIPKPKSMFDPIRGLHLKSPEDMKMTDLRIGNVEFWRSMPISTHRISRSKNTPPD